MTKLTLTINNGSNAQLLLKMLKSLNFIKKIETEQEYESSLTSDEMKLLEERWDDYKKNPESGIPWKKVKADFDKKYGK